MPQPKNQQIVARQVERIVRQLAGLSTLPAVAANLLGQLSDGAFDPVQLAENIQSDPALTARVLALARQEQIFFAAEPTVVEAVAKLPPALLREAIISVKVFEVLDLSHDLDAKRALPRRKMALHSLATACCAGHLAELVLPPEQRQTAYLAGLLHDIGKCALDEVMPKSFEQMVTEADASGVSLLQIEQNHLGLDHTVLGKRLAQKWQLPEPITSGIWLHHCDALTLGADLPDVQIVRVVALADRMVRRAGIGQSGSYDTPEQIDEIAALLSMTPEQIETVVESLPQKVQEKSAVLGLDDVSVTAGYYTMIQKTATHLAEDNRRFSQSSRDAVHLTAQVALIEDFLEDVDENASALELAQSFAAGWKNRMQTGLTGVYVVPDSTEPYVEVAVVSRQGTMEVKSLSMPETVSAIPQAFRTTQAVLPLGEGAKWIVEQFSSDFNPDMMYMAPLRMGEKEVGVLFFEVFSKTDDLLDTERMLPACQVAAAAIAMALSGQRHLELAERFVGLMSTLRQTRTELARQQSLAGLAEMAAGAAHELNNPLAVISGRAQLLLDKEKNKDKKKMLRQIQLRTEDVYQIVNDLMAFARPDEPNKQSVLLSELIQKAIDKTCKACKLKSMEADITGADNCGSVYVDVHQATQALSFILTNALQSYKGETGPLWIECSSAEKNSVSVAIRDTGCGMDAVTLEKATQPFFSFRPAGRRRGMGLAQAQRLLLLNGGTLKLAGEPNKGTTVTITLPKV
ncbi:MAG: HDOD domain-containing protein [Phycisphaerae bacterium]|nr:HDOD domain-containing protein [Phycisphaerae bacterium]